MTGSVAVIITARNAATTIGDAVRSALDQAEVSEVVVVDDASSDATAHAACAAACSDPRLILLRQATNLGPSAARNLAIARSTAPYIAILDADDYLLPGRFTPLFAEPGWDLIADNIVFVPDTFSGRISPEDLPSATGGSTALDLAGFVRGNVARQGLQRGELGFLKPVIRRSSLPASGPVYDPALWLGEDYDLYVRLLLTGARFRLFRQIGYAARVRAGSLSGQHRTADLRALLDATARHKAPDDAAAIAAIGDHRRQLQGRFLLRAFLDMKSARGPGPALAFALAPPTNLVPIARGILADKLAAWRPKVVVPTGLRTLLPVQDPTGPARPASAGSGWQGGTNPAAHAPAASSTTTRK